MSFHLDAHQHFWRYDPADYPWMGPGMERLRRDHLPEELEPLLRAACCDGTIAVQARQTVAETEWLLGLADRHPFIRGVVGWVDLRSGDVGRVLESLCRHPRLVGVRHVVQDEPDDRFLMGRDFRRGLERLREFDLTYDLLVYPRHLGVAAELVAGLPEQPFVLDHLAKPGVKNRQLQPWRRDLERLAAFPNVHCKLSGLVTEAAWGGWCTEDFRPYLDAAVEAFGPERLMAGSDWPVCTLSADYQATTGIVAGYAAQFSPAVRDAILGGNAARFYGIAPPPVNGASASAARR